MLRSLIALLIVLTLFGTWYLFFHEKEVGKKEESNVITHVESKKTVENFIRNSSEGSWELALQYLTGEALDRAKDRYSAVEKQELISLKVNVLLENDLYAEVATDVSTKLKGGRLDRKNYLFRLRNLEGKWKIFDQQNIPFSYGYDAGTLSNEKKKVISEYLNLSAAGRWEEAGKYLTGIRKDIKKVETGSMAIKNIEFVQLTERDGRSLIEASYVLQSNDVEKGMRVLFEVVDVGGIYKISQSYKVGG